MILILGNKVDSIFISEIDSFWHFLVSGFHSELIKLYGLVQNHSKLFRQYKEFGFRYEFVMDSLVFYCKSDYRIIIFLIISAWDIEITELESRKNHTKQNQYWWQTFCWWQVEMLQNDWKIIFNHYTKVNWRKNPKRGIFTDQTPPVPRENHLRSFLRSSEIIKTIEKMLFLIPFSRQRIK